MLPALAALWLTNKLGDVGKETTRALVDAGVPRGLAVTESEPGRGGGAHEHGKPDEAGNGGVWHGRATSCGSACMNSKISTRN
jgi:hypothetical protein